MMLGGQVRKGRAFSVWDTPTRDCVQAAECEEAQAGVPSAGKGGGGHMADGALPCSGGSALSCPALVVGTGMWSSET